MNPSLESLYYFFVLSESCHFSEAACRLYVTQQALSKRIHQLESQLGIQLFESQGRRQVLSPAGKKLQIKAQKIFKQLQKLEDYFGQADFQADSHIVRMAAAFFPRLPVMPVIKQLLKANPNLSFNADSSLSPNAMEEKLLKAELDCAFSLVPPHSPKLAYERISQRKFLVLSHPGFAGLKWNETAYIQFIPTIEALRPLFWPREMQSQRVCAEADLENALSLCERGRGALYLPESFVRHRLMSQRLIQCPHPPFEHDLSTYLIWRKDLAASTLQSQFIQAILARRDS
jgi:DNA-binding transcriptional LysR family regulator